MSRPGSSARSLGSFQSEEGGIAGPSRSPANDYYPHSQMEGFRPDPPVTWEIGQGPVKAVPEGRLVYPMPGHPAGVVTVGGPSGMPRHHPHSHDDGEYIPAEEASYGYPQTTPYHPQHHPHHPPPHHPHMHPGHMHAYTPYHPGPTPHPHSTSPTAMMGQHGHPMMQIHSHSPNDGYHLQSTPMPPQHYYAAPPRRPGMQQRHTAMGAPRPPTLQRQYSLQPPPTRAVDSMAQDVFALAPENTPIRRPSSAMTEYPPESSHFFTLPQGISPARALGPAPNSKHFSPPIDPLITPQTKLPLHAPSSGASTAMTTSSTITSEYSPSENRDDEHDSPTKPPKANPSEIILDPLPRRQIIAPVRLNKSTVIGGRTSAKFAKVAEDPGVEGVPPGPRPTERPTPSFACIIGQAILRCKAGGLSLEHIYRYVETAYPYFKSGDGAWRNSVRHNLSIHKMFETIPRTEKYPPGKGGIWIIHDEEKIHWPSEDKFIKNFPTTHQHHHVCRQTVHERQKESEAIAKARAEGREYVPKKGKKARKFAEDSSTDMVRGNSAMSDGPGPSSSGGYNMHHPLPIASHSIPIPIQRSLSRNMTAKPEPVSPPRVAHKILHPPPFLQPLEEESYGGADEPMPKGTMIPPRFGQKRGFEGDEENVFTAPKRVRVAEPLPLAPIQQESVEDAYVTPERERQMNKAMMGSAFKTPGLVNSTSSPGSSPMPPTIPRTTQHAASGLQQTWTQADISTTSSPACLDAAFDIKPKQRYPVAPGSDDDAPPPSTSTYNPPPLSPRAVPKTPLTRSSAAADRTPRLAHRTPFALTPLMHDGTPLFPPMTVKPQSTPAWEIDGVLVRLGENKELEEGSGRIRMQLFTPGFSTPSLPSSSVPLGLRSPLTSTDPRKYASPKKLIFGVNVEHTPSNSPSLQSLINPLTELKAVIGGPMSMPGDGSPKKAPVTALAVKIGRELRAERERTRSGEMRAGV